jgi:membrane protein
LEVLAELNDARLTERRGRSIDELAAILRVETEALRQVLTVLQGLDWVGRLSEQNEQGQARLVLLVDPEMASVAPLADRLLVHRGSATDPLWLQTGLNQIRVAALLPEKA